MLFPFSTVTLGYLSFYCYFMTPRGDLVFKYSATILFKMFASIKILRDWSKCLVQIQACSVTELFVKRMVFAFHNFIFPFLVKAKSVLHEKSIFVLNSRPPIAFSPIPQLPLKRVKFFTHLDSGTVSIVSSTEQIHSHETKSLLKVMNNLTCDIYIYWFAWFVTTPLQHVDQNYTNLQWTELQDLHF